MVPPNLSEVKLTMETQVQNVTKKMLQSFSDSSSIQISEHSRSDKISELYLRRVDGEYYIYTLGRNGEA